MFRSRTRGTGISGTLCLNNFEPGDWSDVLLESLQGKKDKRMMAVILKQANDLRKISLRNR